ncbi:MAG: hypothetical protein JW751_18970 [Polyangiaceae bacterium]|nr:hypothetical protein [Polyangiaceae bacterium]
MHLAWRRGDGPTTTAVTACRIYEAAELVVDGERAHATFHLAEDAAGRGASTPDRDRAWRAAREYKAGDAEHDFGENGWLDHGSLVRSFEVRVLPDAPPP